MCFKFVYQALIKLRWDYFVINHFPKDNSTLEQASYNSTLEQAFS